MKVKFYCDSGANIHNKREETLDLSNDLGYTDEEWMALSDEEKEEEVELWASQKLDIGYEEIK